MEATDQTPRIAILPTPGMGHLIPLAEFARRLVLHHHISVTFIIPTDAASSLKPQKDVLETLPNSINSIFLPPVSFDDLPEDSKIETRISLSVTRSLPALRDALRELTESTRLLALVVDLFGIFTFDVARELGVPPYLFYPTTAMALSFNFHMPNLDKTYSCEYRDIPDPIGLPGCVPVHGRDLPDPYHDRNNEAYRWALRKSKQNSLAEGIIVNSYMDLEPGAFKALMKEDGLCKPPIYPVGPLVRCGSASVGDGWECMKWLEEQPRGSVLFVSFGSGGTLSCDQLTELALGLELSGQRFLWIVKSPEKSANASYFNVENIKNPFDFLPKGFLDRTKGVGLVVHSWVPQVQVLSHGSTGGFLTHCGWNSTLESIVHGVPLIAWPLFAEQKMNAVLLSEHLKVALRVKVKESGLVEREDIAKYARDLIEGEEGKKLRNKMNDLKDAAAMVLSQDGSSTRSLSDVVQKWMNHNTK